MRTTILAALAAAFIAGPAFAEVIEVQMLNKGPDGERNVFEPAVVQAQPGDTIKFVPTDKGHNAVTLDGMVPEGGQEFESKLNQEFEITLEADGTYGYKCLPHYATGMVGLILVGDASVNFEEAKAVTHRGKAKERMDQYLAEAEEMMASGT